MSHHIIEKPADRLHPISEARRERLGGICQASFYKLVSEGKIRLTKVGRRSFLRESEINRFLEEASNGPGAR